MDISLGPPCPGAHQGHEQTESHIHCQQTCVPVVNNSDNCVQALPSVSHTMMCGILQK